MAIEGQNMFKQGPSGGPTQQGRPNYLDTYPNYYNTHVFNNSSQNTGFRRNNDQPYPPQYNGSNYKILTLIKDNGCSSHQLNRKPTRKPHARPHRHLIRSSVPSRN